MIGNKDHVRLGLRENWLQFLLLVIINAFVGGMVGLERSILPQLAEAEFQVAAKTAILSFIVVFGVFKASSNYFTGALANTLGRKKLLVLGWLVGIPVPFILMYAGSWEWIIVANILLGVNQGLAWSSTVVMKIDIVGEKQRGLAMGLNEFAGYLAVAVVAFLTGYIASEYGLRPYPFYLGIGLVFAGFFSSVFLVKETHHHVKKEAESNLVKRLENVFIDTSWRDRNLGTVTQAGLVNNLNDGMMWGLLPLILTYRGFDLEQVGVVTAAYPAVWGLGQLFTGKMADHVNKKRMLYLGMLLQAVSILLLLLASTFIHFIVLAVALGLGTALVYPTFLATIAEFTHPYDRAQSLGAFRFWRDLGYAIGAVLTGVLADWLGMLVPVLVIGLLTLLSAVVIMIRMQNSSVEKKHKEKEQVEI
ncbi:MFS transporter [Fulvivirga sp. 29W222]|uniref:MFS transporter n=1 Tax=Fulvivirga marina TaxID=2494733 RepID=A0A937G149_9BACT|nr:MFS transporter [Fulvivirga marina]MBL6448732.1 MFS transporter [Fulvivirga marina]